MQWPLTGLHEFIERQEYDAPDIMIGAYPHKGFDLTTFSVPRAKSARPTDEGDVLDLGNSAFEVLHLPGHFPASIDLWEKSTGTLFSGDAIY